MHSRQQLLLLLLLQMLTMQLLPLLLLLWQLQQMLQHMQLLPQEDQALVRALEPICWVSTVPAMVAAMEALVAMGLVVLEEWEAMVWVPPILQQCWVQVPWGRVQEGWVLVQVVLGLVVWVQGQLWLAQGRAQAQAAATQDPMKATVTLKCLQQQMQLFQHSNNCCR
jgi:hypothetical protein